MSTWSRIQTFGFAVGISITGAILFGIVHDLISIRISPAYYTIYHPELIASRNLNLIALSWGVVATWWIGLGAGVFLGLVATAGRLPINSPRDIRRAVTFIVASTAFSAIVAGLYCLVKRPTSPDFANDEWTTLVYVTTVISYLVSSPLTLGTAIWLISRRFQAGLETARATARMKRNLPPA